MEQYELQRCADELQQHGATLLSGIFVPWVETARNAIEENKRQPSWRERTYRPDDSTGNGGAAFFQDYCVWSQFEGYRALVEDSPMAEIAAALMQSQTARIFHDHVLVKEPGNSVVTPWHQDRPYYLVDGEKSVSFWVALDPVPRERTIEYIGGSHRWGQDFKPQRFDGSDLYEGDTADAVPDIDARRDEFDVLGWAVEPGDAVAFHFGTLHGAPANSSAQRRRVISLRWVGDGAHFVERRGKTSPAFPDLSYRGGDPFEAEQFPQLYPRPAGSGL